MCITQSIALEKGVFGKDRIAYEWLQKFIQRQDDLSL